MIGTKIIAGVLVAVAIILAAVAWLLSQRAPESNSSANVVVEQTAKAPMFSAVSYTHLTLPTNREV